MKCCFYPNLASNLLQIECHLQTFLPSPIVGVWLVIKRENTSCVLHRIFLLRVKTTESICDLAITGSSCWSFPNKAIRRSLQTAIRKPKRSVMQVLCRVFSSFESAYVNNLAANSSRVMGVHTDHGRHIQRSISQEQ